MEVEGACVRDQTGWLRRRDGAPCERRDPEFWAQFEETIAGY
jgi:hypothetical protein